MPDHVRFCSQDPTNPTSRFSDGTPIYLDAFICTSVQGPHLLCVPRCLPSHDEDCRANFCGDTTTSSIPNSPPAIKQSYNGLSAATHFWPKVPTLAALSLEPMPASIALYKRLTMLTQVVVKTILVTNFFIKAIIQIFADKKCMRAIAKVDAATHFWGL